MNYINELVAMLCTDVLIIVLFFFIRKQRKGQLKNVFTYLLIAMFIWNTCLILQVLLQNTNIDPFLFEKFAAFGAFPMGGIVLLLGLIFSKRKIKETWWVILLFVIPIISIIMAFTNDYHHLFVEKYMIHVNDTVWGPYFTIHSIYSYATIGGGIVYLIATSSKNSGFFSKQSLLIVVGMLIPVTINILATLSIVSLSVYITPMSYSITMLFFALAIFKFKFLSITPVALQIIVDRISDSYLILDEEFKITDFNKTLLDTFKLKQENVRNQNIFSFMKKEKMDDKKLKDALKKIKGCSNTEVFEIKIDKINRYFTVEVNTIKQKEQFLGTLVLFKDITQHIIDIETIKSNQDILMERERLASLGQLIGGIAHNLKTPIMSVAGATEGLTDLINEYDTSIEDPEVNFEDHHDIANDMREWIKKIKSYIEYMSDIITAVKGQAVAMSEQEAVEFTVEELVKRVNILMKHELKNAIIYLNVEMNVNPNLSLKGEINGLVQVINNIISNAIQAYNGEPEKNIDMIVNKDKDNLIISIRDYAGGLPEKVKEKLFKEMITTKGKNGTGLGMYMSYSNIRAYFGGTITYDSIDGEGTTFNVILPINK